MDIDGKLQNLRGIRLPPIHGEIEVHTPGHILSFMLKLTICFHKNQFQFNFLC